MRQTGRVIWLTGLSGAGKTTVAQRLIERLLHEGIRPVYLDGDQLRAALDGVAGGFDRESRRRLGLAYGRLCQLMSRQGHTVVCATIAMFHEVHSWNRAHLDDYSEIFLEVPLDELYRRDRKGIYGADCVSRDAIGAGIPAEFPANADLVIGNWGEMSPEAAAERIMNFLRDQTSVQEGACPGPVRNQAGSGGRA